MVTAKRLLIYFFLIIALFCSAQYASSTELVSPDSQWKVLTDGSNQGVAWRWTNFDDRWWKSGRPDIDSRSHSLGLNRTNRPVTTYLRQTFDVQDKSSYVSLSLNIGSDKGAIVYLNGTEVYRSNLPSGEIDYKTLALPSAATRIQDSQRVLLNPSLLVEGKNVLAVELHRPLSTRNAPTGFNVSLAAASTCTITRGPYFQSSFSSSVIVRWRTDVACDSQVRFGRSTSNLSIVVSNSTSTTEHQLTVSGLGSWLKYYYTIGTTSATLLSGSNIFFFTNAAYHHPGVTMRFWALGDSGTGDSNAASVRNGYATFNGSHITNMMMLLGNNALPSGTDSDYQNGLFNMYPTFLRLTSVLPAIGETDATSISTFLNIFTLPTVATGGGKNSGSERYFSYNYGIIHFVCLDSSTSDLSPNGPMLTWLKQDLANNTFPWLIAFFHHSPYSKGNHDSDTDARMTAMRANALPILESYGVDLVLGAHSNDYERSFFLNGYYGTSNTLTNSMIINHGDGRPGSQGGDGVYYKQSGAKNGGAVYVVMGSSGKVVTGPLNHPAMFTSQAKLGSFTFDVFNNKLDAKFILTNGSIGDSFTIVKNNQKPSITLTSPTNGQVFTAPATIPFRADASDPDTHIQRVIFWLNSTPKSDYSPPYSYDWPNVKAGTYTVHAEVRDDLGATTKTANISITVK